MYYVQGIKQDIYSLYYGTRIKQNIYLLCLTFIGIKYIYNFMRRCGETCRSEIIHNINKILSRTIFKIEK